MTLNGTDINFRIGHGIGYKNGDKHSAKRILCTKIAMILTLKILTKYGSVYQFLRHELFTKFQARSSNEDSDPPINFGTSPFINQAERSSPITAQASSSPTGAVGASSSHHNDESSRDAATADLLLSSATTNSDNPTYVASPSDATGLGQSSALSPNSSPISSVLRSSPTPLNDPDTEILL